MPDPFRASRATRVLLILLLPALAVAGGRLAAPVLGEEAPSPAAPAGTAASADSPYVGSDACLDCHGEIVDLWRDSTHAKTLLPATPENLPRVMRAGGEIVHPPGRSRFVREGDRVFAETTGPDGKTARYRIDHVLGARRVRMYVTTMPDGRRQVLPFMLDEPYERWFDYTDLLFGGGAGADPAAAPVVHPGEPSFWTGYPRYFDARCGRCHAADFRFTGFSAEAGAPHSSFAHAGVTCEACHGPGRDHVGYWNDEPGFAADPMVKMGDLPKASVNDLCLTCHTEAEPVVPGFRPGDSFHGRFDPTILDDPDRLDPSGRPIELVYDGVPFLASRCAGASEMTCLTCHDPHGGAYRSQLRAAPGSDGLCAACHEEIAAAPAEHSRHDPARTGGQCTACHMPPLVVERGHGVVTDHTIGVPNPGFAGPGIARDACTSCHSGARGQPGGVPRLSEGEVKAAFSKWWPKAEVRPAFAKVLARARAGEADVVPELARVAGDRELPAVVRASAAALLGEFPQAGEPHLRRLAADPDPLVRSRAATGLAAVRTEAADAVLLTLLVDESPLVRRRAAEAALAGWFRVDRTPALLPPTRAALEERTQLFPEDDRAWFLLGAARQIAGDPAGAVAAYERKLQLDPYAHAVRRTVESLKRELAGTDPAPGAGNGDGDDR